MASGERVRVRRIGPEDAAVLRQVRLAALADSPAAFGSTYEREVAFDADVWVGRAETGSAGFERATFFAVTADGSVVGLAGGFRESSEDPVVQLVSMWISPVVRRAGAGRLLVGAVLDWARAGGAQAVELWVTRGNTPAESLYRAVGFEETGDHQPLPSDPCRDETRMTLDLR